MIRCNLEQFRRITETVDFVEDNSLSLQPSKKRFRVVHHTPHTGKLTVEVFSVAEGVTKTGFPDAADTRKPDNRALAPVLFDQSQPELPPYHKSVCWHIVSPNARAFSAGRIPTEIPHRTAIDAHVCHCERIVRSNLGLFRTNRGIASSPATERWTPRNDTRGSSRTLVRTTAAQLCRDASFSTCTAPTNGVWRSSISSPSQNYQRIRTLSFSASNSRPRPSRYDDTAM